MDIQKLLSEAGATEKQIARYLDYQEKGNEKEQERILCRCKGLQLEKLRDKRRQLQCLDYMISKVEKG